MGPLVFVAQGMTFAFSMVAGITYAYGPIGFATIAPLVVFSFLVAMGAQAREVYRR